MAGITLSRHFLFVDVPIDATNASRLDRPQLVDSTGLTDFD